MSVWTAIRRSPATLALLGGAGQFLGEMNKSREELEAEKRAQRTRLGELTLKQMLEEQEKTAAEKRQQQTPLYQAQVGEAKAAQRAHELTGQRTQQEMDYIGSLSPDARQAYEAGKRTPAELQAEIGQKEAYAKYLASGGAGWAKESLHMSKEEQQRQLENDWWTQSAADRAIAQSNPQSDYRVYNLGLEFRLDEKLSPRWKVWLTDYRRREATRAAEAKAKASHPDLNALIQGLAGGGPAVQPGATTTVTAPGETGGLGAPNIGQQGLGLPGGATVPIPGAQPQPVGAAPLTLGPRAQQAVATLMSQGMTQEQAIQGLQARGKNLTE